MVEIELTRGLTAIVDECDAEKLSTNSWCALKTRRENLFYAVARINKKFCYMHHVILGSTNQVDHINGNGLDNRRENLRLVTNAQNQMNKKKWRNKCSSKHKGVAFRAKGRAKSWYAYINLNGKQTSLGYFDSEISAAHAYNKAASKHFGEFARLNKLDGV